MEPINFGTSSEHVRITLPPSFSAEGWGQADVDIAVAGFTGRLCPWVERQDFTLFAAKLRRLYETLDGTAEFSPIERQLTFCLTAGIGGHIQLEGEALFGPVFENRLSFKLDLDQTYLREPLQHIEGL
jgi:hypothetical protein